MKKIQIVLVFLLIVGCSGKEKVKKDYVMHEIDFLNRTLPVPKNYQRITFDEYQTIIKESYDDPAFIEGFVNGVENLKQMFDSYALFCDQDDIRNTLTIFRMDNPKPNDYFGRVVSKQIHAQMKRAGELEGYVYKPLNNRLINGWLFKIKGERHYKEQDMYMYQTTYMAHKFGAYAVHMDKEMDFEEEFTQR